MWPEGGGRVVVGPIYRNAFRLTAGDKHRFAGWGSVDSLPFGQFAFKNRTTLRKPLLDFREQMRECELRKPRPQRGEHGHDHAAALGPGGRLARAAALADFRFVANGALAAIVGRLNLGMFDEDKEASQIIDQFVLQADERRLMIGHRVFVNRFAVRSEERRVGKEGRCRWGADH